MSLFADNQKICSKTIYSKKRARYIVDSVTVSIISRKNIFAENRLLNKRFAEKKINIWRKRCRKYSDDWELFWIILQYVRSYCVICELWRDSPTSVSNLRLLKVIIYEASCLKFRFLKIQIFYLQSPEVYLFKSSQYYWSQILWIYVNIRDINIQRNII